MSDQKHMTTPPDIETMPPGIPYIIGNEAAERFSYYGMRTILITFMHQYLYLMSPTILPQMSEAEARENYHTFASMVYFFPIFGALVSDAITGKYRIIIWVSVLYCLGHLALALMGSPGLSPEQYMWLGLILIAVGSGGIKPCVSAHVGDQFGARNQHLMEKVYQWFYFSINFGSTFSTWLIPIMLDRYGPHIAFGIPGVLMAIATLTFWMGRNVFVHVPPAGPEFIKALVSKDGIMTILKLLIIYSSIAVFWALFDQTSSAWVLQAENMNLNWLGITWLKEQIQVVNPILVMILIPIFQFGVYPAVNKIFTLTPLRKISIGLFLTVASFALSAVVQEWIDEGYRPSISWQIMAFVIITSAEVMVSITGLEFSYAQAPKALKSVVMATWLFSVSLGNVVTAFVNNAIQVPGINSVIEKSEDFTEAGLTETIKGIYLARRENIAPTETDPGEDVVVKSIRIAGHDGQFETEDDVLLDFNKYESLLNVKTQQNDVLGQAKSAIDAAYLASGPDDRTRALPSDEEGKALLQSATSIEVPLKYDAITRDRYRIICADPEGKFLSPWETVLNATVHRVDPNAAQAADKPYSWLEKRIIELKGEQGRREVEAGRGNIPQTSISGDITVGGQVTLDGASYYWAWTGAMLAAAIIFVPISLLYRGRTHLQSENGKAESQQA